MVVVVVVDDSTLLFERRATRLRRRMKFVAGSFVLDVAAVDIGSGSGFVVGCALNIATAAIQARDELWNNNQQSSARKRKNSHNNSRIAD